MNPDTVSPIRVTLSKSLPLSEPLSPLRSDRDKRISDDGGDSMRLTHWALKKGRLEEDSIRPEPPEYGTRPRARKIRCRGGRATLQEPRARAAEARVTPAPSPGPGRKPGRRRGPAAGRGAGARPGSRARGRRGSSISRTKSRSALSALCLLSRQLLPRRSPFVDTVVRKSANVHLSGGPPGLPRVVILPKI